MQALSDSSIPIATLIDSAPWILPFLPRSILPPALAKGKDYWKGLHRHFRDEPFDRAQNSQARCRYVGFNSVYSSKQHTERQLCFQMPCGFETAARLSVTKGSYQACSCDLFIGLWRLVRFFDSMYIDEGFFQVDHLLQ